MNSYINQIEQKINMEIQKNKFLEKDNMNLNLMLKNIKSKHDKEL